jgi:hypothetical protein
VPGRVSIFPTLLAGEMPDEASLTNYVAGVLVLIVPGLLFAVINCFSGVCCCCCRGPCAVMCHRQKYCRVCHCIPATRHYTNEEVCMPVVVWIAFSLLLFAFAVAGVINGTHKFNDSMVRGVCLVDNTYLQFNQFLDNVVSPLDTLKTDFGQAADDLAVATQVDPSLAQNVKDLEARFTDLENAALAAKGATSIGSCKDAWQGIATASSSASASAKASGEELDQTLKDLQASLDSSVVQQKAAADDAIQSGFDTIDQLKDQIKVALDPKAYGLFGYAELMSDNRNNAAFSAYGWIFVVVLIVGGGLTGMHFCRVHAHLATPPKNNPMLPLDVLKLNHIGACGSRFVTVGWCCVFFFGVFSAVFAALTMPLSSVMGDVCVVLPTLPQEIGSLANMTVVDQITDTCWNKTGNLFEGMNIDDQVDTSAISFDSFDDLFGDAVSIAGGDELDELQETLNALTGCGSKTDAQNALNAVKQQKKVAEDAFSDNSAVVTIQEIGKSMIAMIDTAVEGFVSATNCYFISELWAQVSSMICSSLLGSIAWWAASELFIAIIALPFAITTMFVSKRYGGHGPIAQKGAKYEPPAGFIDPRAGQSYVGADGEAAAGLEMIEGAPVTVAGGTVVTVNVNVAADKSDGMAVAPEPEEAAAMWANTEEQGAPMEETQGHLLGQIDASDYGASAEEYIPPVEPPEGAVPLEVGGDGGGVQAAADDGAGMI